MPTREYAVEGGESIINFPEFLSSEFVMIKNPLNWLKEVINNFKIIY